MSDIDLNGDGKVSDREMAMVERRVVAQRRMAWVAMASMCAALTMLFGPWVPIERITVLQDIIPMFFIAQASVVGAFMGFTSWMSSKGK